MNAVFDATTDSYIAQTNTSPPRRLVFKAPAVVANVTTNTAPGVASGLSITAPLAVEIPPGADLRISDCVVCFPEVSGLKPRYFSFMAEPIGRGIVSGNGHSVSGDWWASAVQNQGAVIPAQMGEQLRSREFRSFDTFDKSIWRMTADSAALGKTFDEINKKRIAKGFAPYAPRSTWVGDRREFEIRISTPTELGVDDFNLDTLRITAPNSTFGAIRKAPVFVPWPVATGSRTWTPLIPPGIETLGPTELPPTLEEPVVYPGPPTTPVATGNEALPVPDPADIANHIPGFGDGDELPSPDLVFAGPPVEPLEVGPYNELRARSKLDGLDIDHVVSQKALKMFILENVPMMSSTDLSDHLRKAPSIAIPSEVHRKFSETYGGRNTKAQQFKDASNLRKAVDNNMDAIKTGLIEAGLENDKIEAARKSLHRLNQAQGWY